MKSEYKLSKDARTRHVNSKEPDFLPYSTLCVKPSEYWHKTVQMEGFAEQIENMWNSENSSYTEFILKLPMRFPYRMMPTIIRVHKVFGIVRGEDIFTNRKVNHLEVEILFDCAVTSVVRFSIHMYDLKGNLNTRELLELYITMGFEQFNNIWEETNKHLNNDYQTARRGGNAITDVNYTKEELLVLLKEYL